MLTSLFYYKAMNFIISYYLLLFAASQFGGKETCRFKIPKAYIFLSQPKLSTSPTIIANLDWESTCAQAPKLSPWSPPPPKLLKVNFETVITSNTVTLAVVCHNHLVEIPFLRSHNTTDPGDPVWIETKAFLFVVEKNC